MPFHKKKPIDYKSHRVWAENLSLVIQIGLTMAGCILLCFFIGRYLDRWLGAKGVFVTIFTLLGVLGGGNTVYRQIIKATEEDYKRKNGPENGVG